MSLALSSALDMNGEPGDELLRVREATVKVGDLTEGMRFGEMLTP
jgi:hypothetical protein